jgi:hypothetical protein
MNSTRALAEPLSGNFLALSSASDPAKLSINQIKTCWNLYIPGRANKDSIDAIEKLMEHCTMPSLLFWKSP